MLANAAASTALAPPSDDTITSLYFTSIPSTHNDTQHLTDFITPLLAGSSASESGPAGLRGVVPVPATNCAFVNFKSRQDAEHVAQQLVMRNIGKDSKKVIISFGEEEVGVQWGRSKKPKKTAATVTTTEKPQQEVTA